MCREQFRVVLPERGDPCDGDWRSILGEPRRADTRRSADRRDHATWGHRRRLCVDYLAQRMRQHTAHEPLHREALLRDECVDEPNGIVGADIIVHSLRQQQKLRTFESKNVSHVRF
jgi:hypothetical protein